MIGLIVLICLYIMLGFLLAWIAGVVAREEVEVKTGVLILVLTGFVSLGVRVLFGEALGESALVVIPLVNLAMLTLLLHAIAGLEWKHSAIIAVIYAVILTLVGIGLTSCTA